MQALSSMDHIDLEFYAIVSSIIYQLSLHFNFEVEFVRRQTNMIAHILSKTTCIFNSYHFVLIIRVNYSPLPSKMLELQSPPLLC